MPRLTASSKSSPKIGWSDDAEKLMIEGRCQFLVTWSWMIISKAFTTVDNQKSIRRFTMLAIFAVPESVPAAQEATAVPWLSPSLKGSPSNDQRVLIRPINSE